MGAMKLNIDEFWDKLCNPRCVRVGRTRCVIGMESYETDVAPEDIPGFVEGKIELTLGYLGPVNPTLDAIVFFMLHVLAYAIPAAIAISILMWVGVT